MLSPTVSAPSLEGTSTPEQQRSRRRGLSYLRSLSSHSSNPNNSDQTRSPRSFFQRSSSYNNENKSRQQLQPPVHPTTGRRRSASRPNLPTSPPSERPTLTRVLSAGNSPIPSPVPPPENTSPTDETRQSRPSERTQDPTNAAVTVITTSPEDMARSSRPARPSTPRRVTDSVLPSAGDGARTAATTATRPISMSISNGTLSTDGAPAPARSDEEKEKDKPKAPMIRLFPHQDLRNNGRQSLNFSPISRTLPGEQSIIRVGRYSEREGLPIANPTHPSDAPVGFKSKVVSRKHCEFSFVDGQWHIRDVSSSSGTFLNHIRLSQPNQESRLFPIKDGDIVQLGIDFRGGEEMIFRCVKIRIECNRSWQKKPNNFNKTRQAQLLGLSKDQPAAGSNNGECSICLGSVLPCQALFVAPCAHVWHYKCIRPMLDGKQSQYPSFQCPNCRAWTDLEADVDVADEDMDAWMENGGDTDDHLDIDQTERPEGTENNGENAQSATSDNPMPPVLEETPATPEANGVTGPTTPKSGLLSRRTHANAAGSEASSVNSIPMPARPSAEEIGDHLANQSTRTDSTNGEHIIAGEGPLTPRNNAGPFVFDGSGGTGENRRRTLFVPGLFEVAENAQA